MSDNNRLTALSVFLPSVMLVIAWLWFQAKPVVITNASSTQVACLSYAPYRLPGESPFWRNGTVTPERIRTDLTLLRKHTNCIRTYAVSEGLDAVPSIAKSLEMRVMLGIWISRNHQENLAKIDSALKLANEYPDTVQALIVGNEVLLRREQTVERMAQYLHKAQQGTNVPVTYADVWEFWEANASLQSQVDFVTVHILPYWEDHPVSVDNSVDHITETFQHVTGLFPGKRVVIGETGWPSIGRMRGPARPGRVEQARFIRAFLADAQARGFSDYNLIEAFDQPWKRLLEGAMGGGWGLLSSSGNGKFPMSGPVAERPGAFHQGLLWGGLAALTVALANLLGVQRHRPETNLSGKGRWPHLLLSGASGFVAGALLLPQVTYLVHWSRHPSEWIAGGTIVMAGWLLILVLPWLIPGQPVAGVTSLRKWQSWPPTLWAVARFVVVFGAAFMILMHAFDARYRGYPTLLYLPATLALVAAWLSGSGITRGAIEERCLAGLCILLVPFMLWPEMPANSQSAWFAVLIAALALVTLLPATGVLAPLRTRTSSPSSKPKAPNSAV